MKGKFIVLDGGDGSGKGTQTQILVKRLRDEGYQVEMADFPQYGQWSCQFVERYLRGEFGGSHEINAKKGSLFYALDRYAASFTIRKWLEEGKIVISNRYVSANKGHQLGKIAHTEEMHDFLAWVNDMEYSVLGIPVPDVTLYLHMSAAIGQQLVDKKEARDYIQGKKRDIHEADLGHLENAERAYHFCLEHDSIEKWQKISCFSEDSPRTIEDIHKDIYGAVSTVLKG
jgi:dTMP kinase